MPFATAIAAVAVAVALPLSLAVAAGSPAPASTPVCVPALPTGSSGLTLRVDGVTREVIVRAPDVPPAGRMPAVIALHGYTAHAWQLEQTSGLSERATALGFVAAYPEALGTPTDWTFTGHPGPGADDLKMIGQLLDALIADGCVDPGRVVLVGHSMGGGMAADAACRLADRVAAAVLVSATWFALPCEPVRPIPVVILHALDDATLPYTGGPIGGVPGGAPEVLPVDVAAAAWAARDGCAAEPIESAADDGRVRVAWPGCRAPVTLWRSPSGGHAWPDIATDLIVELLQDGGSSPG